MPLLAACTAAEAAPAERSNIAGTATSCLQAAAVVCEAPQCAIALEEEAMMHAVQLPPMDTHTGTAPGMFPPLENCFNCPSLDIPGEPVLKKSSRGVEES